MFDFACYSIATTYQERRAAAIWWHNLRQRAARIRDEYESHQEERYSAQRRILAETLQAEREEGADE